MKKAQHHGLPVCLRLLAPCKAPVSRPTWLYYPMRLSSCRLRPERELGTTQKPRPQKLSQAALGTPNELSQPLPCLAKIQLILTEHRQHTRAFPPCNSTNIWLIAIY